MAIDAIIKDIQIKLPEVIEPKIDSEVADVEVILPEPPPAPEVNAKITNIEITLPEEIPSEKTWWEKLLDFLIITHPFYTGISEVAAGEIYKLVTDEELTEAKFTELKLEIADFILPLNALSKLFTGKNLKGEAEEFDPTWDNIDLILSALIFIPFSKFGKVGAKLIPKLTSKTAIRVAGRNITAWRALFKGASQAEQIKMIRKLIADENGWIILKGLFKTKSLSPELVKAASAAERRVLTDGILGKTGLKMPTWIKIALGGATFILMYAAFQWSDFVFGLRKNKILDPYPIDLVNDATYAGNDAINALEGIKFNCNVEAYNITLSLVNEVNVLWDRAITYAEENPEADSDWSSVVGTLRAYMGLEPYYTSESMSAAIIEGKKFFNDQVEVEKSAIVSNCPIIAIIEGVEVPPEEEEEEIPPEEVVGNLKIDAIDELGSSEDIEIEVAGQPEITTTGIYQLSPGSYDVKASKEGFVSQTKTGYVSETKDGAVSFILKKVEEVEPVPAKATITITSIPTDSDVYIDGEYTFTKTPYTIILEAGNYIFRVQKSGFYPEEVIAEVEEGETAEIPFVLTEIPTPEIPTEPYIPYQPVYPAGYENLYPAYYSAPEYEAPAPVPEKELLLNIETTDLYPWNGRIYSIAIQDLSLPETAPIVLIDDDEEKLILQFLDLFNQLNPEKLVGFKLTFDHRYIFAKMMLYRIQNKAFKEIEMRDVKQIMDQVKEEFVYFPSKVGTLDDWGKMLLGIGKLGSQELMLRKYLAGDFEYVKAFQERQMEITNGLYQLSRFCGSESLTSPIQSNPETDSVPQYDVGIFPAKTPGQKQCKNCLAYNPIEAKACVVCGQEF